MCILGGGFGGLYTALRLESLEWPDGKRPQVIWPFKRITVCMLCCALDPSLASAGAFKYQFTFLCHLFYSFYSILCLCLCIIEDPYISSSIS